MSVVTQIRKLGFQSCKHCGVCGSDLHVFIQIGTVQFKHVAQISSVYIES